MPYLVSTRHLPSKIERDPTCEPSYKMLLEPPSGAPDYLITEIALPGVVRIIPDISSIYHIIYRRLNLY